MIEKLIGTLLQLLEIPHTKLFLKETLKSIPYDNSLYGMSLLLARYNIATDNVRLSDKHDLSSDEMPCIILYDGEFVILTQVSESEVIMLSSKSQPVSVNREEFDKKWDGIALIPRLTAQSREPDYKIHRKAELKNRLIKLSFGLIIAIMTCLFACQSSHALEWGWWSILATNILGCVVSTFLLQNQLDIHTTLSERICGLVKSGDCDSVTHSSGANLFGIFKLSEVGFSFFITNLVALTIYSQAIPILAIISYLVLPFSFWSVWYQKFRAKKWCVLCLCVLLTMWIQAILYCFSGIIAEYSVNILTLSITCFMYLFFYLAVNIFMNILADKKESEHWQYDLINLKSQDEVLSAYFQDSKYIDGEAGSGLVFGNPQSPVEITVFSNPYCSPCAAMHEKLKDTPGDLAKVRYILTYFDENLSIINRNIIAAYQQLGAEKTWEILNQWHLKGSEEGETFFEKYNLNPDTPEVWSEFHKQQEWNKNHVLSGTPKVFINGRVITWPYSAEDFKLISDIL